MTVYILLGEGFEEIEAIAPGDILRRGGVRVVYAALEGSGVTGAHGITLVADTVLSAVTIKRGDYVIIPGGLGGVQSLEASQEAAAFLLTASQCGATLCAICAGPRVLARLGLLTGRDVTCYPGLEREMTGAHCHEDAAVMVDGDRITGRGPGTAMEFGLVILEEIKGRRTAEQVRKGMVYAG